VAPSASLRRMSSTVIRVPRITGFPSIVPGSTITRDSRAGAFEAMSFPLFEERAPLTSRRDFITPAVYRRAVFTFP